MSATNNVVGMVNRIIRGYKVPVTATQANEYLLTHPDFPDLVSISDAFDEWNIDHATLRLKKEQLTDVETPFMATIQHDDEPLIVVDKIDNDIIYYQTAKGSVKVGIDEFAKLWNGVVIAVSPDEHSGEKDYTASIKKERMNTLKKVFAYCYGALFLFLALRYAISSSDAILVPVLSIQLLLAATGIVLSGFLYAYDKNAAPDFVKSICRAGTNFNCNSVLQSDASKLFGIISWAEIGLVYFAGFFLSLLWANTNTPGLLAWINVAALPYTVFSVYYQAVIAKKWCILCTAIQLLLWMQFCSFFYSPISYKAIIGSNADMQILFSFGLAAFALLFTNKLLDDKRQAGTLKREVNKYKKNPDIFKNMLNAGRYINTDMGGRFIIGNPIAPVTITIATSLTCAPCARAHKAIKELLNKSNDIKVQCVFSIPRGGEPLEALKYIGAVYEQHGANAGEKVLERWFEHKRSDSIKNLFAVDMNSFDSDRFTGLYAEAGKMFQITHTPTIFVNGRLLPDLYNVGDINFWLPYIIQNEQQAFAN